MKKQLMLVSIATTALIFAGCGGDKKVEERVAEIQTNAPVADTNSAAVTTPAPKTEAVKPQAQKESEAPKEAPVVAKEKAPAEQPKAKEVAASVPAASPAEGKQIFASRCAACHGQNGEGKASYPKLAGLSKEEALSRLKGYVDGTYGKAQKMIMVGQAKGLDDKQKAAVSEYIATLK